MPHFQTIYRCHQRCVMPPLQCSAVGTVVTEGSCTIKGYVFDRDTYGSALGPYFPASSPWVTTVAATMVRTLF
jgi:hypothetical protein